MADVLTKTKITVEIELDDNQRAGILNAMKTANLQIGINNLQQGKNEPLLKPKDMISEMIQGWASQQYDQMFSQRGQQAMEAFKKLPEDVKENMLVNVLKVPPLTNLDDWVD